MTVEVSTTGLTSFLGQLQTRIGVATAEGVAKGALVYERAIKETIRGGHKKGTKTGAIPGGPPQNVTGNLRRSVAVGPVRGAGLRWEIEIGPSASYAGFLEEGTERMPAYPSVGPAAHRVEASGEAHAVIVAAWRRALGV